MSAWWWACQDEGTLIRESANDDARPPEHDHPLQLVSPAIAAALRERERMRAIVTAAKRWAEAETEIKHICHEGRCFRCSIDSEMFNAVNALAPVAPKAATPDGGERCGECGTLRKHHDRYGCLKFQPAAPKEKP